MGKIAYFHSYVDFWRENSKDFHIHQYQKLKKKLHFSNSLIWILTFKKKRQNYLFQFLNIYFRRENSNTFSEKKNENMVTFVATNNFPNWHWNSITIFGNVEECVLSTMKLDDAFQSTLLFKGSLSIRKMKRYGSFLEKRYASTVKW